MDLIYTNANREDIGVLRDYELDLAFGADENNFECRIQAQSHCCEDGSLLYIDGTEYGGIVDSVGSITEDKEVIYSGRTWHGILASKVIMPLQEGEESPTQSVPSIQSRLPDGYTELEHIESSGTQYINTGYVPNANTKAVLTYQLTNPNTSNQAIFGVAGQFSFRWYGSSGCFRSNGGNSVDFPKTIDATAKHTVVKETLTTTLDETHTLTTTAGTVSQTLYLFAQHHATSGAQTLSSIKVFSFKLYDSNVLVRDFVPCRNPSNVIGLYDVVNSVFYPNLGSGTFTAGAVVTGKLPDGYTKVEYIESSGTQYIDTGFTPNQDTRVVMVTEFVAQEDSAYLFGSRAGSYSKIYSFQGLGSKYCSRYCDNEVTVKDSSISGKFTIDKNKNVVTINDTYTATHTYASFTCPGSMYIFAGNDNGTMYANSIAKVYSCQMYDNGTLVRNFVPCKKANGIAGFYDLVNSVFYENAGTGVFTTGAEIEEPEDTEDVANVTIKLKDSDGSSLVDKYLVISGDANQCILHIINRCNLSSFFTISEDASQISVDEYQFHRFTDAYSGLMKMCESVGAKLRFAFDGSKVVLSAIKAVDYSKDEEFDSDVIDFEITKQYNTVNHLICLGSGELENRLVVHLYADAEGKISQKQTFFDLDEYSAIYDYSAVESEEELIKEGKKRFKELRTDSISVNINETEDLYDVGDVIGATDNITGIFVADVIAKKIVTIKNGQITISYKVGD